MYKPIRQRVLARQGSRAGSAVLLVAFLTQGVAAGQGNGGVSANRLRRVIAEQTGGLNRLQVPERDADLPVPRQINGIVSPRYRTTEAKRYLGKLLFHDPVRSARININAGQPLDLPAGTAFGGTLSASDANVQAIMESQRLDTSCGSCHLGEAATKAGQQLNFASGGEGRGYTDARGDFIPRRRIRSNLSRALLPPFRRTAPIFPGDLLVDALPTLADVYTIDGKAELTSPARFFHMPAVSALVATGRLDQLDSVGRQAMSMIGFAFNNRLLFGGLAGEPQATAGSLNPLSDPAGENMTLLLLDAHRMLNFQASELLKIPAFVKLFRDAFPEEAALADSRNDMTLLVNDDTEFRAQATFLRTVVTRNTPFDRFLGGDNDALSPAQRRGALLFFTPATNGAGGAGCYGCHSGPMLNKQPNDPDVAGIGTFVEENFINVGIGDHPVQALNAMARGRLNPNRLGIDGFPYHAEDTGRQEVTQNGNDAFKFRSLTLRQLRDARTFFHNGSFTKIRDVVEYFNEGVPQDPTAGASPTLSARFTNPRGPGYPRGLGLTERQMNDLTDFIENGLYDPAFVVYNPRSSTDSFQPNERDLTYSRYRPDLAALGARDGFLLSGLAIDSNDALSRRDQGLEFLDVTTQASVERIGTGSEGRRQTDRYRITNRSQSVIDTHLLLIVRGLPNGTELVNASGVARNQNPYVRVFLPNGVLEPGQSIVQTFTFDRDDSNRGQPLNYVIDLLSGQGRP